MCKCTFSYLSRKHNNIYIYIYIYIYFFYKVFVLGITMQLDISAKLTPQVTTIICHHIKKKLLKKEKRKKIQKYGGLDQNSYVNTNDT